MRSRCALLVRCAIANGGLAGDHGRTVGALSLLDGIQQTAGNGGAVFGAALARVRAEALAEKPYGQSEPDDVAMKVIADHSRAAAFLIGDGVLPSNEGRGYVLRRIMRRAIRYGRNIGLTKPFLHETARVVFDIMAPAYPDLKAASAFITNVIENEEVRFSETLDNGLRVLNDSLAEIRATGSTRVPGDLIFKLFHRSCS